VTANANCNGREWNDETKRVVDIGILKEDLNCNTDDGILEEDFKKNNKDSQELYASSKSLAN
jgi:hypothetical protein